MPVVGGFKHALVSDGMGLNVDNSTPRGCPLYSQKRTLIFLPVQKTPTIQTISEFTGGMLAQGGKSCRSNATSPRFPPSSRRIQRCGSRAGILRQAPRLD